MNAYLRRRIVAHISVIAITLSILGSLEPLIQLANIVRYIVVHWHEITSVFWNSILHLFGLQAGPTAVALLTAGTFCFALEVSAVIAPRHEPSWKSTTLVVINRIVISLYFFTILGAAYFRYEGQLEPIPDPLALDNWQDRKNWVVLGAWVYANMFLIGPAGNPYVLGKRLLEITTLCVAAILFSYIAIYGPILRGWLSSF